MKRLFIRSIQVELLNNLFDKINKDKILTDILDNGKQSRNINKNFNKIFLTKKIGDFSILNIELKKIINIRNEKYDELYFFHKQNGIRGLENIIILSIFLNTKKIYHIKYNPNQLNLDNKKEIKKNKLFVYLFESILTLLLMPIGIIMTLFFFTFSIIKTEKN